MLRKITGCLVLLLLATHVVAAQDQAESPDVRARRPAAGAGPMAVIQMLDAYAIVQAQDVLQLNDDQYAAFVTRLKKLQDTRRRNQQARNQLVRELQKLTTPAGGRANQGRGVDSANPDPIKANEPVIRERLKALRELDDRSAAELRQAYDALDAVLDVRQQGRFRVFEEMLERRKLDLLLRARQAAARGR